MITADEPNSQHLSASVRLGATADVVVIELHKRSIDARQRYVLPSITVKVQLGKRAAIADMIQTGQPTNVVELFPPEVQKQGVPLVAAQREPVFDLAFLSGDRSDVEIARYSLTFFIPAHDRAPPVASKVYPAVELLVDRNVPAQCIDIQIAVVVNIDKLAAPAPAARRHRQSWRFGARNSFKGSGKIAQ